MVTSLLDHERIQTTDAKAKEVRRVAERMITLGKRGGLHARRRALRVIRRKEVATKVFDELAERYRDRPGGYTRVVKLRNRTGDAAPISIVELVEAGDVAKPKRAKKAKQAGAEKEAAAKTAKKSTAKTAKTAKKPAAKTAKKPAAKTAKKSAAKTAKKSAAKTAKKSAAKTAKKSAAKTAKKSD
jgi:large subunit ribosomal protein L17